MCQFVAKEIPQLSHGAETESRNKGNEEGATKQKGQEKKK